MLLLSLIRGENFYLYNIILCIHIIKQNETALAEAEVNN